MLDARFLGDFQYPVSSIEYPADLKLEWGDLLVTALPFVSLCFLERARKMKAPTSRRTPKIARKASWHMTLGPLKFKNDFRL